ncbi:helix-turn-helix domain-containing protein [Shewanella corallii]|uniref:Helix-turn-helix domain-containing protein n=1 Tax=Shewanella corallii TaxID=560080 RepID=A0ABT0NAI1_9GAMM|nr:helix-turn-helix domain-containing protein [Shewanella corallii]
MQLNKDCRLEAGKQQLIFSRCNEPVSLSFAETAILECLLRHQGEVVSKEALQQAGWPGRVVASSSLMQCISQLRKKLESEQDIELKTIPRHGYALHLSSDFNPLQPNAPDQSTSKTKLWWLLLPALLTVALLIFWQRPVITPVWLSSTADIKVNNTSAHVQVYRTPDMKTPSDSQLQSLANQQITPEPNWQSPFDNYQGFALLSADNQSFALCPNYQGSQCPGDKLINISSDSLKGGHVELSDFLATKIRMEQKTYNKLLLPELTASSGELKEEVYHADLYFKIQDHLLVRSDFRISLVHLEQDSGLFYFAACVTDEACSSSPIRFEIRGDFKQSHQQWQGQKIDIFTVDINKTELSSPNALSAAAQSLYLTLRKQHLTQEQMTFYRLYQDDDTSVWLVPLQQYNMVWMQKLELHY